MSIKTRKMLVLLAMGVELGLFLAGAIALLLDRFEFSANALAVAYFVQTVHTRASSRIDADAGRRQTVTESQARRLGGRRAA